MRCIVLVLSSAMLAACGQGDDRPQGVHCRTVGAGAEKPAAMSPSNAGMAGRTGPPAYSPFTVSSQLAAMGVEERRPANVVVYDKNKRFREKLASIFNDPERPEVNILSISAGGEFGAFGAGFFNGLAARSGDAPTKFHIVNGVSTGALIAPLVFTGRGEDYEAMKRQYTTVTDEDLISARSKLGVAFSNSLYRTDKLRKRIGEVMTADFVAELARIATDERRVLAVMAVNLDSGQPEIFDLTAIASGEGKYAEFSAEERRQRIIDAMTASSGIPIAFEPTFIAKEMYVDGGARQQAFIGAELSVAAASSPNPRPGPGPGLKTYTVLPSSGPNAKPVRLFAVVNSDYRIKTDCTSNSVTGVAARTFSVTVNQMLYDSIFRLLTNARNQGWETHVADARLVTAPPGEEAGESEACVRPDSSDFFNRPFMQCLYRKACERAYRDRNPWCEGLDCLPQEVALSAVGTAEAKPLPAACSVDSAGG